MIRFIPLLLLMGCQVRPVRLHGEDTLLLPFPESARQQEEMHIIRTSPHFAPFR